MDRDSISPNTPQLYGKLLPPPHTNTKLADPWGKQVVVGLKQPRMYHALVKALSQCLPFQFLPRPRGI